MFALSLGVSLLRPRLASVSTLRGGSRALSTRSAVSRGAVAGAGGGAVMALAGGALASSASLPGDLSVTEHKIKVPLDHNAPRGPTIEVFVRELRRASRADDEQPYLLYLQGGPGFPSARPSAPAGGWQAAALDAGFRVLLLDQRGTGSSTPVTAQTLRGVGDADAQAAYLQHFRADSIVKDCEVVRKQLCANKKITLLGQSFGGFCILSYLSFAPKAIERALFTFGLAPITKTADDVYRATFTRMEERCRKYYARYPGDVELVRSIVRTLDAEPAPMPRGGTLTARRFLQLGLLLGSGSGLETLHDLLEHAFVDTADGPVLADGFLLAVEAAQQGFETNPIYWLLHEAIYCEPGSGASAWAAERVQASLGDAWDYKTRLKEGAAPVLLTGEMVYSWMGDDYAWLRELKPVAEKLAQKSDWAPLYDEAALRSGTAPCAALVSYEDIYVERAFSEETAAVLGPRCKCWITNEFQHSGLRDQPAVVFERLYKMAKGEVAIPS